MRIVLAPNSFRGSLTAHEAVAAMKAGAIRAFPRVDIIEKPMADGGDGTLEVLASAWNADIISEQIRGPMQKPAIAKWGLTHDGNAIIEMAQAAGNRLIPAGSQDPMKAGTHGVGELIRSALDRGARNFVIGLGGSATVDGGAGALHVLGLRFLDRSGRVLEPVPEKLTQLHRINTSSLDKRLIASKVTVLADVDTPAKLAARVYGPQKGLRSEEIPRVNILLRKLAALAGNRDAVEMPMGGAAGGFGMGLFLFARGALVRGSSWLAKVIQLPKAIETANFVLTGEGRFDPSSLAGKAPAAVMELANQYKVPAVVFSGTNSDDITLPSENTLVTLITEGESIDTAMANAGQRLTSAVTKYFGKLREKGSSMQ